MDLDLDRHTAAVGLKLHNMDLGFELKLHSMDSDSDWYNSVDCSIDFGIVPDFALVEASPHY